MIKETINKLIEYWGIDAISIFTSFTALVISVITGLYALRTYYLEKYKFKYEKELREQEALKEVEKNKLLTRIDDPLAVYDFISTAKPLIKTFHSVSCLAKPRKGYEISAIPKSGRKIDLLGIKCNANLLVFNQTELPMWIKLIEPGLYFRPRISPLYRKLGLEKFTGYEEFFNTDIDHTNKDGFRTVVNSQQHTSTWYLNDFELSLFIWTRLLHGVPAPNKMMTSSLTSYGTSDLVTFEQPIEISPKAYRRFHSSLEITPEGIRYLFDIKFLPSAVAFRIYWNDEVVRTDTNIKFESGIIQTPTTGMPLFEPFQLDSLDIVWQNK